MSSKSLESTALEAEATGFSALGDPTRLRILGLLQSGQRCVCELLEDVGIAPNLMSYHLRVLRKAGLVEGTRRGRWIHYRLASERLEALQAAVPAQRDA